MFKPLLIFAVTFAGAGLAAGADSGPSGKDVASAALKAYAAMNYMQADKLAKQIPDTPEGQLVSGLCDLYDRSHQNIEREHRDDADAGCGDDRRVLLRAL